MVVVMKYCAAQLTVHYILPIPAGNNLILIYNVGEVGNVIEGKKGLLKS